MIYLDHAATTPVLPDVFAAMEPWLRSEFGNPSSLYASGRRARAAVELAREKIGASIGAKPDAVTLTASGSEANNLLIKGMTNAASRAPFHIVLSSIEHPCLDRAVAQAEGLSTGRVTSTRIDPRRDGVVRLDDLKAARRKDTRLVCLMAVNNETGAVQPWREAAIWCRNEAIAFHVDACQALGRIGLGDLATLATSATICAHKIFGPKGAAALIAEPSVSLLSLVTGGHQEGGRRAGTENVAAIVGFGAAAELASKDLIKRRDHASQCEEALMSALIDQGVGFSETVLQEARVPGIMMLLLAGITNEEALVGLDRAGIAISTGAACQSGSIEPSRVLGAMGYGDDRRRAIRVSCGLASEPSTMEQVAKALAVLIARRKE